VVDFIPAHHGTSVIRHFYQIALQQQDTVDEEDYRYLARSLARASRRS